MDLRSPCHRAPPRSGAHPMNDTQRARLIRTRSSVAIPGSGLTIASRLDQRWSASTASVCLCIKRGCPRTAGFSRPDVDGERRRCCERCEIVLRSWLPSRPTSSRLKPAVRASSRSTRGRSRRSRTRTPGRSRSRRGAPNACPRRRPRRRGKPAPRAASRGPGSRRARARRRDERARARRGTRRRPPAP